MAVQDYIRERFFPHLWCQGCGHGIVLNGLLRAFDELKLKKNDIVMVSGIGCSSHFTAGGLIRLFRSHIVDVRRI